MTGLYKLIITVLLFFTITPNQSLGGEVIVYGNAPSYKNETITFYTYHDWITKTTKKLKETKVDQQGNFKCTFSTEHTQKIFVNLGVYKAYLFVEPSKTYELVLPEKEEKSKAQKLNPYFEGIPHHIGIKNTTTNQLNLKIYRFLKAYNNTINKNINKIYASPKIIDSLVHYLDTLIQYDNDFFRNYKKYKLGELRTISKNSSDQIKYQLFKKHKICYTNPAFMEMFNKVFENYLSNYYTQYSGDVFKIVNMHQSLTKLDSTLMKDSLLTEDPILRELVMLKGLYDGFYSNKFNKKAIIDMIDTFSSFSQNDYHIAISQKIYEKITKLREGHEPPDFRLYDRDSNLVCLDSLKGHYIYLGFCNSMNYSCLRDYKVLNNLYKKHKDHFKIIIISTEENPETLEHYVEQKNIPWTMLHYGNDPEVLKKYNVKVMPSYFFINPDGKLSISPAPGPSEKIEWEIFKLMRKRGDLR